MWLVRLLGRGLLGSRISFSPFFISLGLGWRTDWCRFLGFVFPCSQHWDEKIWGLKTKRKENAIAREGVWGVLFVLAHITTEKKERIKGREAGQSVL